MFSEDHKLQKNCLPVKMFCISVVWRILGQLEQTLSFGNNLYTDDNNGKTYDSIIQ
jgi:hypothetical protein